MRVDGLSKIIASTRPSSGRSPRCAARRRPSAGGCRRGCRAASPAGELGQIEEMPRRAHAAPSLGGGAPRQRRRARRRAGRTASSTSASPTMSGGSRRTTLSPAGTRSRPSARAAAATSPFGHAALDAEHQPLAADFLDEVGMRVGDGGELLLQEQAGAAHAARGKPSSRTMSSTAAPTAMASGLPPKVVPCVPAVMPAEASRVARQAPTGKAARRGPWRAPRCRA